MAISADRWALRNDAPRVIPHHAAPVRQPLRFEVHVDGVRKSRHGTLTAAVLAKLGGAGALMVRVGNGVVPWSRGGVA